MSISRFGDGELGIMLNNSNIGFQESSELLKEKLTEAFSNPNQNLLVCLPRALNSTKGRKKPNKDFWINWGISGNQKKLKKLISELDMNACCFGDAQITRPYIAYKCSKNADVVFPLLKRIWNGRDLLIIEGEHTCLGVGNDLFSNANSIKRIIAPAKNAFDYLEEIRAAATELYQDELIIMALGPTATVLASEFADMNMQALDLGHIDLEYIWYRQKAQEIAPVNDRYVNECDNNHETAECKDERYKKEIIYTINSEKK